MQTVDEGRWRILGRALMSTGLILTFLAMVTIAGIRLYAALRYLTVIIGPVLILGPVLVVVGFVLKRKHRKADVPSDARAKYNRFSWLGIAAAAVWVFGGQYVVALGMTWVGCHVFGDTEACELRFDQVWPTAYGYSRQCSWSDTHCHELLALPQDEWEARGLTDYAPTPAAWLCKRHPERCEEGEPRLEPSVDDSLH